jgi:hypothetical protein
MQKLPLYCTKNSIETRKRLIHRIFRHPMSSTQIDSYHILIIRKTKVRISAQFQTADIGCPKIRILYFPKSPDIHQ